ncbi:hypothetical protein V1291_004968 [Nitrobacteraceae bacterium AZCC 1564]
MERMQKLLVERLPDVVIRLPDPDHPHVALGTGWPFLSKTRGQPVVHAFLPIVLQHTLPRVAAGDVREFIEYCSPLS